MKKIIFPLLLFIIIFTCKNVYAETFTQSNRFTWYSYTNSDTMVNTGTGLIPYSTNVLNRVQWLYSTYTYDPNYLYDITFTVKNKTFPGNDYNIYDFTNACSISTGGGVQYQCYLNKSHSDYEDIISISILNFVGTNQSQLWLNIYSDSNKALYLETTSYSLQINRKDNKNVTSDDIYNSTQNIINNDNNNTKQIIDNQNDNTQDIIDNNNSTTQQIIDNQNNSTTTQANNEGTSWFNNFHVDSTRGFSSIITAPIRLINGILSGSSSCSPLSFNVSLKHNSTTQSNEVSLPCGSILWNNVPNTAVLLYWSTIFGLFAWWVLRDMYLFIDSIRDPDSKTEFLMNL